MACCDAAPPIVCIFRTEDQQPMVAASEKVAALLKRIDPEA
jgi:hypothetical protein